VWEDWGLLYRHETKPFAQIHGGLLTAEEIAERLGMKTQWVWAEARAGRIPHVRLGRYQRFRESAVDAWLRNLEAGSTPPETTEPPSPVQLRRRA
jgi:excisionase family DNA binding protein